MEEGNIFRRLLLWWSKFT